MLLVRAEDIRMGKLVKVQLEFNLSENAFFRMDHVLLLEAVAHQRETVLGMHMVSSQAMQAF